MKHFGTDKANSCDNKKRTKNKVNVISSPHASRAGHKAVTFLIQHSRFCVVALATLQLFYPSTPPSHFSLSHFLYTPNLKSIIQNACKIRYFTARGCEIIPIYDPTCEKKLIVTHTQCTFKPRRKQTKCQHLLTRLLGFTWSKCRPFQNFEQISFTKYPVLKENLSELGNN